MGLKRESERERFLKSSSFLNILYDKNTDGLCVCKMYSIILKLYFRATCDFSDFILFHVRDCYLKKGEREGKRDGFYKEKQQFPKPNSFLTINDKIRMICRESLTWAMVCLNCFVLNNTFLFSCTCNKAQKVHEMFNKA